MNDSRVKLVRKDSRAEPSRNTANKAKKRQNIVNKVKQESKKASKAKKELEIVGELLMNCR